MLEGASGTGFVAGTGAFASRERAGRVLEYGTLVIADVTDVDEDEVEQLFTVCTDRIAAELGPPDRQRGGRLVEKGWSRERVVILLQADSRSIALDLVAPRHQALIDAMTMSSVWDRVRTTDWDWFEAGLMQVMGRLPYVSGLTLTARGSQYAELNMCGDSLECEVGSGECSDDGRHLRQSEDGMTQLGWHLQATGSGTHWSYVTEQPANELGYIAVARGVTRALRDVMQVATPRDMTVEIWSNNVVGIPDFRELTAG